MKDLTLVPVLAMALLGTFETFLCSSQVMPVLLPDLERIVANTDGQHATSLRRRATSIVRSMVDLLADAYGAYPAEVKSLLVPMLAPWCRIFGEILGQPHHCACTILEPRPLASQSCKMSNGCQGRYRGLISALSWYAIHQACDS